MKAATCVDGLVSRADVKKDLKGHWSWNGGVFRNHSDTIFKLRDFVGLLDWIDLSNSLSLKSNRWTVFSNLV